MPEIVIDVEEALKYADRIEHFQDLAPNERRIIVLARACRGARIGAPLAIGHASACAVELVQQFAEAEFNRGLCGTDATEVERVALLGYIAKLEAADPSPRMDGHPE